MSSFVDYLKKEMVIESVFEIYKDNLNIDTDSRVLKKIIDYIYSIKILKETHIKTINFSPFSLEIEIFGNIYEEKLNHDERKILGEFYTPITVVNYILNATGYSCENAIEDKKLIDISCGSGSFIIQAIKRLIKRHLIIFKRKNSIELEINEAKEIIKKVKGNIYGIDINPIACILCQINIHLILFNILRKIRKLEKNFQLPIFKIRNTNALLIDNKEKYDFVVGNPPYLFIRDIPKDQRQIIENGNFETKEGQYDYYQIFIEIGIKILRNQGLFGYIVPDSLLALINRSPIRKYIYSTSKIKELYYTGPKFDELVVANIIIILEKEKNKLGREKNLIKIKAQDQPEKFIPQMTLKKWDYRFLIHLNDEDISIMDHLNENFPKLYEFNKNRAFKITLNRGVELTKSGEIIFCKKCKKYSPIPKNQLICNECNAPLKKEYVEKIIHDSFPKDSRENYKLFVYSISRYRINQYKYIDISKTGINYKELESYNDRIIIRQLSQNNLICATYDNNLSLTSQSFYNLKIEKSPTLEFNNFYLLGILNSTFLSYYFLKSFGSYKKLFPRILIEKIKTFPIKIPETQVEKVKATEIAENVKVILETIVKKEEKIIEKQEKIDSLVFDLYGIQDNYREYIFQFMKNL